MIRETSHTNLSTCPVKEVTERVVEERVWPFSRSSMRTVGLLVPVFRTRTANSSSPLGALAGVGNDTWSHVSAVDDMTSELGLTRIGVFVPER